MNEGVTGAVIPSFIIQDPTAPNPSGSPLRVCFAHLHQDAPLLDLGPKGLGPLGLSPSREPDALLRSRDPRRVAALAWKTRVIRLA